MTFIERTAIGRPLTNVTTVMDPKSSPVLTYLLAGLALSIPFNGIYPILPIGELSRELFFFVSVIFLLVASTSAFRCRQKIILLDPLLMTMLVWAGFTVLVNAEAISSNTLGARTAGSKAATAFAVLAYHVFFVGVLAGVVKRLGIQRAARAVAIGVILVAVPLCILLTFEILSWYRTDVRDFVLSIRQIFTDSHRFVPFRLSGVSYEPSFNAVFLLFILPWIWWVAGDIKKSQRRVLVYFLLIWTISLILVSGTRTGLIGIVLIFVYILLKYVFCTMLGSRIGMRFSIVSLFLTIAAGLWSYFIFEHLIIRSYDPSSHSLLTRAAAVQASIDMAWGNPIFGLGIGQFGINYPKFIPDFGWRSYETVEYFMGQRGPVTPPSYNTFALVLAELGIVGAFVWLAFLWRSFLSFSINNSRLAPTPSRLAMCLELTLVISVATMFSISSFRLAHLWIPAAFALAARRSQMHTSNYQSV